ncbi:TerD family protein [Nocardia sp. NBC_00508]|uniref:TerD family protein n=1 Tax=Nocardia sp. NBC_00508 TaxID=2975992 RepID=UPI002E7FE982|nr:TerD family protein [Nocardia sp. NBC_00508]WUD65941.1 TerD family protein [Nocardia sp. NBC_00508]
MVISLPDDSGAELQFIRMALGWDPVRRRGFGMRDRDIDLNASALVFAADRIMDVVYHEQLISRDGAVRHLGDSTTGEGKGDNEVITVDLTRLSEQATSMIFLVTSYSGQPFGQIDNAFCRMVDGASDTEIARYDLSAHGENTGMVMGRVLRTSGGWQFESICEGIRAQHPVEAVPQLAAFLA